MTVYQCSKQRLEKKVSCLHGLKFEFLDSVHKNCTSDNDGKSDLLNECILPNVFGLTVSIVQNRVLGEKICLSDRGIYLVF